MGMHTTRKPQRWSPEEFSGCKWTTSRSAAPLTRKLTSFTSFTSLAWVRSSVSRCGMSRSSIQIGAAENEHITPNSRQELELHLAKAEGLEIFSEAAVDAAAEATAVESVIYVRVPASLKLRVEAAAEKAKLSCKHTLYGAFSRASEKPMLKRSFARWPYSNEPRVAPI